VIKVKVKTDTYIHSLEISGHAGGINGSDIVCAGVSAVVIGGFNELLRNNNKLIHIIREGYAYVELNNNQELQIITKTILTQLETIQESYQKKVKIQRI
jgi:uncharacterized protein YsxB (DUF464 family)